MGFRAHQNNGDPQKKWGDIHHPIYYLNRKILNVKND